MILSPLVTVLFCYGIFISMHATMPTALAKNKITGIKEYVIGEQSTRRQSCDGRKMAFVDAIFDNVDDVGPPYKMNSDLDKTKEEMPALFVDYANMIRNAIILLDNSAETRTRKRGNVKINNQEIPDVTCSCNFNKEIIDLGENCYPRFLENRNCSAEMCTPPYKCKPNVYELTILKRKTSAMEQSLIEIPSDLRHRWIAEKQSVTIGCMCARDYIIEN